MLKSDGAKWENVDVEESHGGEKNGEKEKFKTVFE